MRSNELVVLAGAAIYSAEGGGFEGTTDWPANRLGVPTAFHALYLGERTEILAGPAAIATRQCQYSVHKTNAGILGVDMPQLPQMLFSGIELSLFNQDHCQAIVGGRLLFGTGIQREGFS